MSKQIEQLGNYAFFRQMGEAPRPDDMHDGSIAFHNEGLHDESDKQHTRLEDDLTQYGDVHIVREHELVGSGSRRVRARSSEASAASAADAWMRANGHKW